MITALLVIAILVLLIVVHELGHFIVAKIFRVRVDEFGIGYPPRAFTFGTIRETTYTLNWIPFGGFVRLYGEDGGTHGRGAFADASRLTQACILVAGVAMNVVMAWVLFAVALHIGTLRPVDPLDRGVGAELLISGIIPGSPAESAGLRVGDRIENISDTSGNVLTAPTPQTVSDFVEARGGRPLTVFYRHGGSVSTVVVTPAHAVIPQEAGRAGLGIAMVEVSTQALPWTSAAYEALQQTYFSFGDVVHNLGNLLGSIFRGAPNLSGVVGPIGIVGFVGDAAQNGIGAVLILAALISVNLAVINLIPIPALDGGRLFVLALEWILRRNMPHLAVQLLNALGILLIAFLMFAVTYNDIARLFV
jgi:regulator of sigma E protease